MASDTIAPQITAGRDDTPKAAIEKIALKNSALEKSIVSMAEL